jgi:TonB family protein
MNRILFFLFCSPFFSYAQQIKLNEYDCFLKAHVVETFPLTVLDTGNNSAVLSFRSDSSSIKMKLTGKVDTANVIGENEQVILLFDNDSTATLRSAGLQTYEMHDTYYNYYHSYSLSLNDLIRLRDANLQALRQYDSKDFYDVVIPAGSREKIRQLSALFIDELYTANVIEVKVAAREPQFPGGEKALADFLKRNIRMSPAVNATANSTVVVQLRILPDGTVSGTDIVQSGGTIFDAEALRVIRRMPKWKPAIQNGRAIHGSVRQEIRFERTETAERY